MKSGSSGTVALNASAMIGALRARNRRISAASIGEPERSAMKKDQSWKASMCSLVSPPR
ncbi:hypothetical protein D3C86_2265570 [compost metagenome]